MNKHVRNGFSTVRPYVYGPHSILNFVEKSLGGKVLVRHEQGGNAQHVEDVDLAVEQAEKCEVEIFSPPEDKPYEERQAGIRDAYGNVWWVATYRVS